MSFQELNAADLVILIILGLACLRGLFRGLVRSVLSLATLTAAVAVVWLYAGSFADAMAGMIESAALRSALAFLSLFLGVMLLGNVVLARLLTGIVSLAGLTVMDRALGGGFGILWGTLLVCLALSLLRIFFSEADFWAESLLIPMGLALLEWAAAIFPESSNPGACAAGIHGCESAPVHAPGWHIMAAPTWQEG